MLRGKGKRNSKKATKKATKIMEKRSLELPEPDRFVRGVNNILGYIIGLGFSNEMMQVQFVFRSDFVILTE